MGSDLQPDARKRCAALSGPPGGCRIREFASYDCVALRHERERLAGILLSGKAAFMSRDYKEAIRHDLTDIDYLLSEIEKQSGNGLEHSKE